MFGYQVREDGLGLLCGSRGTDEDCLFGVFDGFRGSLVEQSLYPRILGFSSLSEGGGGRLEVRVHCPLHRGPKATFAKIFGGFQVEKNSPPIRQMVSRTYQE